MKLSNKKAKFTLGFVAASAAFIGVFQNFTLGPATPAAKTCTQGKINEILEPASASKKTVSVNCSVKLSSSNVITKQLVFQGLAASGSTFNCNGAKLVPNQSSPESADRIVIRSKKLSQFEWERPENILIKNCNLTGSVRIYGMGKNGEAVDVRDSSRSFPDHSTRAKNAAPRKITFDNMKISGLGRVPLYLSPGVTYFTLQNSVVAGQSDSVAIYLDAESAYNTLTNNQIHTKTSKRELIAIDGSARNKIIGNRFSSLSNGGIYAYRNCGEGGTVRHQKPHSNHIMNNVFHYVKYSGSNPAVYLGSRNGNRNYCQDDYGFPWGSSANDGDFAVNNVVADNQFLARDPAGLIASKGTNNIQRNTKVVSATEKLSSCYLDKEQLFVLSGKAKITTETNGSCKKASCADGVLTKVAATCPAKPVCPAHIPKSGSCKYDVGLYRDGQRGSVTGYFKYDDNCRFSVRVVASYNKADTGYVPSNVTQVVGDRGYRYTVKADDYGLSVTSSAGQQVCQLRF